jgi:CheY-like chemotaxis protein
VSVDGTLSRVDMPPSHLHQVVLNLLMNAHDATRERGTGRQVSVRASNCSRAPIAGVARSERWVQITITDNGEGIAPAIRRKIFEPFFSTKAERKGTGLGLSNVKALVERVGGWVEVDSEERVGTSVHVFLPLAAEALMDLAGEVGHTPGAARVLICDDETRLADLTAGLLEEFGYHAAAVAEGGEAVEAALKTGIQVLILDVNLSAGLSAHDVLSTLDQVGAHVAVILTSGLALNEVAPALRDHRLVVGYLGKPYTVEELTSGIEQALEHVRSEG